MYVFIFPFWKDVVMFQTSTRQHKVSFKVCYIKIRNSKTLTVSYTTSTSEGYPQQWQQALYHIALTCYSATGNSPVCGTNRCRVSPWSAGKLQNSSFSQGILPLLPCMSAWYDRVPFSNMFTDLLKQYFRSFQATTVFNSWHCLRGRW